MQNFVENVGEEVLSNEIVFPNFREKIDDFIGKLSENLHKEGLRTQKRKVDGTTHLKVMNSFISIGEFIFRQKEKSMKASYIRKGRKLALGLILPPTIGLTLISLLLVPQLAVVVLIPLAVGGIFFSRKLRILTYKIAKAIDKTVEKFPEMRERLREFQNKKMQAAPADSNCPRCSALLIMKDVMRERRKE